MQNAYFSLCGCRTSLCRRLKMAHKIPLNMGWHINILHYIFILILIVCHYYYCVGVIEHSWCIHTNISIRFQLPELRQFSLKMVEILFFGLICGEIVWIESGETLGTQALLPYWQSQLVIFYQIIVHYRTVLAILLPSTTFSWSSKLRSRDLDCAICSICRYWGAYWANFMCCKFLVNRTTGKHVLKCAENKYTIFGELKKW